MINALRYWKIMNGVLYKKYVYNYKFPTLVKLPLTPKEVVVPLGVAQYLINNLGDLRIK